MSTIPVSLAIPQPRKLAARLWSWLSSATGLVLLLALVDFASHLAVAGNYGYFRDELYYLAAGHHIALGYVDFPPLIALLAWLMNVLAGDNLIAIQQFQLGLIDVGHFGRPERRLRDDCFSQRWPARSALWPR